MEIVYRNNPVYQAMKSALSFTAVAFLDISNTAALVKLLLLPIETNMAVCEFQATRMPTIAG